MMKDIIEKITDSAVAFGIACFLIITISLFVGGGVIGVAVCTLIWAFMISVKVPVYTKQFFDFNQDIKGRPYKKIHKLIFYHFLSIYTSMFLVIFCIFYLMDYETISTYLYNLNKWLIDPIIELIPTIENHALAAKDRGITKYHFYSLFYSLAYTLATLSPIVAIFNYNALSSTPVDPDKKSHIAKYKYLYLAFVLTFIAVTAILTYLTFDTSYEFFSKHPLRNYNSKINDNHFRNYIPVTAFMGWLNFISLTVFFKTIKNLKGSKSG